MLHKVKDRAKKKREREQREDDLTKQACLPTMEAVEHDNTLFGLHDVAEKDALRKRQRVLCRNAPVVRDEAIKLTIQQKRGVRQQQKIGKRLGYSAKKIVTELSTITASSVVKDALDGDVHKDMVDMMCARDGDSEVNVKAKELMTSLVDSAADRLREFITDQVTEIVDRDVQREKLHNVVVEQTEIKAAMLENKDIAGAVRAARKVKAAEDTLIRLGSKEDDVEEIDKLTTWVKCVRKNVPAFTSTMNVTVVMPKKRSNDGMGGMKRGTTTKEQPLGMSSWEMAAMAANGKRSNTSRNMLMIVNPKSCPNCGEDMVTAGRGTMRCDPCNFTSDQSSCLTQDIQDEKVQCMQRSEYHSTYHFRTRLMATQGKTPKRVKPEEYKEIARVLWERGITKHTVTPWMLRYTLRELGLSHLFPVISSIFTVMTGFRTRKLPRYVRDEVDTMVKYLHGRWPAFQKLMDIMIKNAGRRNRRKKKGSAQNRRNRPNTHYCLWLLSEQRGHPEMKDEVLTIFDPDNMAYKDCIARAVFGNLGWEWPATRDASVAAYLKLHKDAKEIITSPALKDRVTPAAEIVNVGKKTRKRASPTKKQSSAKQVRE